ncbi:LCP family protein [Propionibacterium sp.]|uniref:LCP family glycopolymer transferase n=1 Tax=Propionibacterium sp. TaxID=1977903 RepID=UPI0039ED5575
MVSRGNGSQDSAPRRAADNDHDNYVPRHARQYQPPEPADNGPAVPGGQHRPATSDGALYDVEREGLRGAPRAEQADPSGIAPPDPRLGRPPTLDYSAGFPGTIARTTIGTLLPGTGLLGTRRTLLGLVIFVCTVIVCGIAALIGWLHPEIFIKIFMSSTGFTLLGIGLASISLFWAILVLGTYLVSRPRRMTGKQRIVGAAVVFVISILVATPTAVASAYAFTSGGLVSNVFGNANSRSKTRPHITNKANPFADKERLNILLLGGDSGAGRDDQLGLRTDTVILASIDTHTGNTVLIQLPRNLENVPFQSGSDLAKVYPNGRTWDGVTGSEDSYMLNAVWNEVPQEHPELFKDTDFAGADATKLAVGGITGLNVDYFVMINIDGIQKLVDAMGGVTVNINFPIAKGGHVDGYGDEACGVDGNLPVGPNEHLGGSDAMWYARSRCNDPDYDYGRMRRQSCLINAVIKQANPQTMLTRYEAIASAGQQMMSTDIPEDLLDDIAELALKVKDAQVTRVVFAQSLDGTPVPNEVVPGNPDYPAMRTTIEDAIWASQNPGQTPTPTPSETYGVNPTTEPSISATDEPSGTPSPTQTLAPAENLTDVCGYNPVK